MMDLHLQFLGTDGETDYLLDVYSDGSHVLATRPAAGGTWGPPVTLARQGAAS